MFRGQLSLRGDVRASVCATADVKRRLWFNLCAFVFVVFSEGDPVQQGASAPRCEPRRESTHSF